SIKTVGASDSEGRTAKRHSDRWRSPDHTRHWNDGVLDQRRASRCVLSSRVQMEGSRVRDCEWRFPIRFQQRSFGLEVDGVSNDAAKVAELSPRGRGLRFEDSLRSNRMRTPGLAIMIVLLGFATCSTMTALIAMPNHSFAIKETNVEPRNGILSGAL